MAAGINGARRGGEGPDRIERRNISPDGRAAMKSIMDALGEMRKALAAEMNYLSDALDGKDIFGIGK